MKATITFDFDESLQSALASIITKGTGTITETPAEKPAEIVTPAFEDSKFIGARVCLGDEDFVIAAKDYRGGMSMPWQEAMDALKADNLSTWNYRQICLTMAYRDEIDKVLEDNGGDSLDGWYWISDGYSERRSFSYYGFNGSLEIDSKNNNECSIRPIKNLKEE